MKLAAWDVRNTWKHAYNMLFRIIQRLANYSVNSDTTVQGRSVVMELFAGQFKCPDQDNGNSL